MFNGPTLPLFLMWIKTNICLVRMNVSSPSKYKSIHKKEMKQRLGLYSLYNLILQLGIFPHTPDSNCKRYFLWLQKNKCFHFVYK